MDSPILHCVFFRRGSAVGDADLTALYEAFAALIERLPGASDFKGGVNVSVEGFDRGYKDGFTVRFENAAARDAYLENAEHVALAERLVALIAGGTDGLLVFDQRV